MRLAGLFALVVYGLSAPVSGQTYEARPAIQPEETILRVKGQGKTQAAPDRMSVTVGVTTTAATAAEALEANNRKLASVIEMLRRRGVMPSDMQTASLDVEPQYSERRDRSADQIIGFSANNRLTVTSRELERAGDLVSALFDAGANSIDGPHFEVAEGLKERLAREAEADALREARSQADSTAEALGLRVSRILLVSDSKVEFRGGSGYIVVTGSRISRTPIEPGEIEVTAEYDVEFSAIAM